MNHEPGMTSRELRHFLEDKYNNDLTWTDNYLEPNYHETIKTMHKAISNSAAPKMTKLYYQTELYTFRAASFINRLGFSFMTSIDRIE